MDAATRGLVRERAGNQCEFCGLPQEAEAFFTFHIEHIIAQQHGGGDTPENLALACYHCNLHKGTNLTGIDAQSGELVRLYHPREQPWTEHFRRNGDVIEGRTAVGRVTVSLLKMNAADRRRLRG
ncbi:MAG: hypothetical protein QOE70_4855 [Chthoniobacter sp.]|jgi:5-methylcytosine-specific restriction endonuclease McrA|nr:hypothetical protein [Chthoniobacter sp.]